MPDLPLSAGELHSMRHTADTYLPGTAFLYPAVRTSDGQGSFTVSYPDASGTVAARLAAASDAALGSGGESVVGGRLAEVTPWVLTLPAGTTIDEGYRVSFAGSTYEVVAVLTRVPEEISRRVRLVEVV